MVEDEQEHTMVVEWNYHVHVKDLITLHDWWDRINGIMDLDNHHDRFQH
jgi:hypothetical protein